MADTNDKVKEPGTDQQTALALIEGKWNLPESWGVGANHAQLVTSVDETTQEGRDFLMAAMMQPGDNPAAWINKEVALQNVTIHPIQFVSDETGELVRTTRVLLHTEDGHTLDFRSDGILKSLYLIFRFQGRPPYKNPKRFILERLDVGQNRSMYALRPVAAAKADKPVKSK